MAVMLCGQRKSKGGPIPTLPRGGRTRSVRFLQPTFLEGGGLVNKKYH